MKRIALLLCVALCPSLATKAQSAAPSSDERYVREYYARLSFLTRIGAVSEAAMLNTNGQHVVSRDQLAALVKSLEAVFTIQNVTSGNLADIASQPWIEHVTPSTNMNGVLMFTLDKRTFGDPDADAEWYYSTASWAPVDTSNALAGLGGAWTVQWVMDNGSRMFLTPDVVYTRYVDYTITSSFQGRDNGPYHAMMIFGKNSKGQNVAIAQDQGNQGSGMGPQITEENLYPIGLLRTHLRDSEVIADWLREQSRTASLCATVKDGVCCAADRCTVTAEDVQKDLTQPPVKTRRVASVPPTALR